MTASMTSHRGCTRVAVPVLGSCPAGHFQNIHSPVPAVHAITFVSIHSWNQIDEELTVPPIIPPTIPMSPPLPPCC
jgi:hypothetical protein